jgi:hypothetical protein
MAVAGRDTASAATTSASRREQRWTDGRGGARDQHGSVQQANSTTKSSEWQLVREGRVVVMVEAMKERHARNVTN